MAQYSLLYDRAQERLKSLSAHVLLGSAWLYGATASARSCKILQGLKWQGPRLSWAQRFSLTTRRSASDRFTAAHELQAP